MSPKQPYALARDIAFQNHAARAGFLAQTQAKKHCGEVKFFILQGLKDINRNEEKSLLNRC